MNNIIDEFKEMEEHRKHKLRELKKLLTDLSNKWATNKYLADKIWKHPSQITRLRNPTEYKLKISTIQNYIDLLTK